MLVQNLASKRRVQFNKVFTHPQMFSFVVFFLHFFFFLFLFHELFLTQLFLFSVSVHVPVLCAIHHRYHDNQFCSSARAYAYLAPTNLLLQFVVVFRLASFSQSLLHFFCIVFPLNNVRLSPAQPLHVCYRVDVWGLHCELFSWVCCCGAWCMWVSRFVLFISPHIFSVFFFSLMWVNRKSPFAKPGTPSHTPSPHPHPHSHR
jgi:hypothetical protein